MCVCVFCGSMITRLLLFSQIMGGVFLWSNVERRKRRWRGGGVWGGGKQTGGGEGSGGCQLSEFPVFVSAALREIKSSWFKQSSTNSWSSDRLSVNMPCQCLLSFNGTPACPRPTLRGRPLCALLAPPFRGQPSRWFCFSLRSSVTSVCLPKLFVTLVWTLRNLLNAAVCLFWLL